jgi:prepilin-type processing-associated H-X9-DG protein
MQPGDVHLDKIPDSISAGLHGKGVHVGFADGAVWRLSKDVPIHDLKKLCTLEGATQHDRERLLGPYAIRRAYDEGNRNSSGR